MCVYVCVFIYLNLLKMFYVEFTLFQRQLGSGPSPQHCLYFQDFQGSKFKVPYVINKSK